MARVVGKDRHDTRRDASVSSSRMVLVVGLGILSSFKVLILAAYIHHGTVAVARGSDFLATAQNCVSRYLQDTQSPQHIRDCVCRYIQADGHSDLTRLRWIQFGEFSCKAESVYSTRFRYVVGSSLL
jgi:hypothetical protein